MAVVLPFLRTGGVGDWSLADRARLARLGDRLAPQADVEVAFGRSDAGDPWCVVTDGDGEVLIHVARIGGKFVVHDAAADLLREGGELWSLLLQVLRTPEPEPWTSQVLAFPLPSRQAQTLIALITTAAFLREAERSAQGELAALVDLPGDRSPWTPPEVVTDDAPAQPAATSAGSAPAGQPDSPTAQPPPAARTHVETAASAAYASAPPSPAERATRASAPDPASSENADSESPKAPPRMLAGTRDDDRLTGSAAAETLYGGDGDDVLDGGGAPDGEADRLVGGGGGDTLMLAARAVAEGGSGGDRFVLPDRSGAAGVVLDFRADEGDRVQTSGGDEAAVLAAEHVDDVLLDFRGTSAVEAQSSPLPGFRVSFDADDDGVADTVLLIAGDWTDAPPPAPAESVDFVL